MAPCHADMARVDCIGRRPGNVGSPSGGDGSGTAAQRPRPPANSPPVKDDGADRRSALTTVGDLFDWWTDEHLPARVAAGAIKPRTLVAHRGSLAHLRTLRKVRVDELTARHVDRVTRAMAAGGNPRGGGYSASAVRNTVVALQGAVRDATRKGLIAPTGRRVRRETRRPDRRAGRRHP